VRIGVIGGGVTGLTAGYELTKLGHHVEVFEKDSVLGGQASTFDLDGVPLERAYHHIFMSDSHIVGLMGELGLSGRLRWIDSSVGLYHSGRIWDWVTPLDLLRFSPISLWDRLRLGLVTLYLQRSARWRGYESVTAADWLTRRVGRRAYRAVWEPLLRGKFGDYHDEVSMAWLWGKIRLRVGSRGKSLQREKLGYAVGSFGTVWEELSRRIVTGGGQVHTSSPVARIEVEEGRARGLRVVPPGQEETSLPFDAVLATIPSFEFVRIADSLPRDVVAKLNAVTYLAALVLVLVLERPLMPVYWLNIADRSIPFVGAIEHTNFVPPEQYGGRHILYVSNYLSRDNPLCSMASEELVSEYAPHLKKINPSFDAAWIRESRVFREEGAQPIVTTDYSQRIPEHRMPITGLYLANTTQIYPEDRGVNYSVRLGKAAAAAVVQDLA